MTDAPLAYTPLHALHKELGAKTAAFAGYDMPINFPAGIVAEHLHCRKAAALFDVSHMGQATLAGEGAAAGLESLVPGDIAGLRVGHTRYTLFTDESGGVLDDLMVTNRGSDLYLVVNAGCKAQDLAHLRASLPGTVAVREHADRALLAIQGPAAASVVGRLATGATALAFMAYGEFDLAGHACWVTRSGYTGEDGFEISVAASKAEALARRLLAEPEVAPAGLGARDSLRLEAGLCLYGHDLDRSTDPVEAGLGWTIGKRRREQGGFPGARFVLARLKEGPARKRVGIRPDGRAPAREGTAICDASGRRIGTVTSGGFGPAVGGPIAMGYVETASAAVGTTVSAIVRDVPRPARVVALPFVAHRYRRP